MKVAIQYPDDWSISADPPDNDGRIWFFIRAGQMAGGLYLTPEQVRELRDELQNALDAVTVAA